MCQWPNDVVIGYCYAKGEFYLVIACRQAGKCGVNFRYTPKN